MDNTNRRVERAAARRTEYSPPKGKAYTGNIDAVRSRETPQLRSLGHCLETLAEAFPNSFEGHVEELTEAMVVVPDDKVRQSLLGVL